MSIHVKPVNRSAGKHIFVFLFIVIALVTGNVYGTDGITPTSLARAWEIVGLENEAIKASRTGIQQAEYKKQGTAALRLPSVSLSANYLYLDDAVELSPQDVFESMEAGAYAAQVAADLGASYGLTPAQLNTGLTSTILERSNITSSVTASWPIFTGGRISAAQDIAAQQVEVRRQDLRLETLKQFENLVRYYYGAVLARQVLKTRQEAEAGLKKHRDHAILLEEQGQIAKVERMQSEASHDKAMVERRKSERDLEIARVALSKTLKSSTPVIPADDLFIAEHLPPLDTCIDDTLAHYPGLALLDTKKRQAEDVAGAEKGKYFPAVALVGNYNLYEEDNLATKLAPDWFVGVGVSVPLIDRSGRRGKMQAAQSAMKQIDHLRLQAESDLSVLVERTYRQVLQALEEYKGLRSSLDLAQETVRLRAKAFSQGLGTSLDVVDAELFLAGVKTQRAAAMHKYVIGLAKLMAVSGRPEAFFNYQNDRGIENGS